MRPKVGLTVLVACTLTATLSLRLARADIVVGTLSTAVGDSIPSADLATWLGTSVSPTNAQQLVLLAECFGGNTSLAFANAKAMAVLSATSQNQLAVYGGYDLGAAQALAPGAGVTAQLVQDAGVQQAKTAKTGETPIVAGTLQPKDFSLANAAAAGAIQGREVLVYAGSPDGGKTTTDASLRDTIAKNFKNEVNTNVRTAGGTNGSGGGGAGWTGEGSAAGLKSTIAAAGKAIAAAANPAKEQAIVYVTDHGGVRNVAKDLNRSAPTGQATPANSVLVKSDVVNITFTKIVSNFQTFLKNLLPPNVINRNAGGESSVPPAPDSPLAKSPTYSILVPYSDNNALNPTDDLRPNALRGFKSWALDLVKPGGNVNNANDVIATLFDSFQLTYNPAGGNAFKNADDLNKNSGIRVFFTLSGQPGEKEFDDLYYNQKFDVYLANATGTDYKVGEFAQEAPQVSPLAAAPTPEPSTLVHASIGGIAFLARINRHRRKRA